MQLLSLKNNDDTLIKLPHSNYGSKSIFFGSNICPFLNERVYSHHSTQAEDILKTEEKVKSAANIVRLKANNEKLKATIETANILAHNLKSSLSPLELAFSDRNVPEKHRNMLKLVHKKLSHTIEDIQLLDTAHSTTYTNEKLLPYNVSQLTLDVCQDIALLYKEDQHINFSYNVIDANIFCKVPVKPYRDAIYNLVKNAYEAIEYKGRVSLSMNIIKSNLEVVVSDDGKGIPAHLIKHIGRKRFTFAKKQGTGIGLYQVKKMLSRSNGSLKVDTQKDKGLRIKLVIPILSIG